MPKYLRHCTTFLGLTLLLSVVLAVSCDIDSNNSSASDPSLLAKKPNIVLIVSDDLGWADMSHRGSEIETPALDRIAAEGVSLSRHYVQPLCTPTRAALLSGRLPIRYGLQYRPLRPWDRHGFPKQETLLSEALQQAGYRTACIGKWHLGHAKPEHHPLSRGFDYFYGLITGAHDYFSHHRGEARDWQRNGVSLDETGYSTDLLGNDAAKFISKQANEAAPFFLYLAFNAPHTPLQAPDDLIQKYISKHGERRATYMAMVDSMDQSIQKVLTALDETEQSDNTIVLFINDNGGARIEGASNKPLRGGKGSTQEGGIRVPALVKWPGQIPANSTSEQVFSAQDWMPSLLAAANLPTKIAFDGINLLDVLQQKSEPSLRQNLFFGTISEKGWYMSIIDNQQKYVRRNLPNGKVVEKLFNIFSDPNEDTNLAPENEDDVIRLRKLALKWHSLSPDGDPVMVTKAPDNWEVPEDWATASKP